MDPRDRPSERLTGASCAACGEPVPADRVRVLASREEVAFAEVPCAPCGSVGLAIFVGGRGDDPNADQPGDLRPAAAEPDALGADDILDMHVFLAGWTGDLRSLVGRTDRSRGT